MTATQITAPVSFSGSNASAILFSLRTAETARVCANWSGMEFGEARMTLLAEADRLEGTMASGDLRAFRNQLAEAQALLTVLGLR